MSPLSFARILLAATLGMFAGVLRADDAIQYNRDIRPILAENCFRCHGPDSAARKADLRLDQREQAVKLGAFKPGSPDESELVRRIFSDDAGERMPPEAAHKELTASQKDLLKKWIAAGAEYQAHWSLIAPRKSELPRVSNEAWARTPIDRFILAKMEASGLSPAAEADRPTLARRVSLDLTGLPPSPADVERFVRDPSSDAYEKYVDRLLALPAWGEHRARYWLDVARYADTHGYHFDNYRENWAFRNYVIQAFNKNMPFDQFTIEQLAGDLLPDPTLEQKIATGFNRCNMSTNEGGAINEEYLVLYARDRTETTSQAWLGLTFGCAVCHDHKFDPISQKEFYQLAAFFNNTTQPALDGNVKDAVPNVPVPRVEDRAEWEALLKQLPEVRAQQDARRQAARGDYDQWLSGGDFADIAALIPTDGLVFHAPLNEGADNVVKVIVDGQARELALAHDVAWQTGYISERAYRARADVIVEVPDAGDFEKDQAFTYSAWVRLGTANQTGSVMSRLDDAHDFRGWDMWIEGGKLAAHLISKWDTDAIKVVSDTNLPPNRWNHLLVSYNGSGQAAGVKLYVNGALQRKTSAKADALKNSLRNDVPLKIGQRNKGSLLTNALIQDVRVYQRELSEREVVNVANATRADWLASRRSVRTTMQANELFQLWLVTLDPTARQLAEQRAKLDDQQATLRARGTVAYVMQERAAAPSAFVLFRGEYSQRRDRVDAGTPELLPPLAADLPHNRLGLAKWLLQADNPLTARVTVNRFWQEIFGTGLVRTVGDFGVTGEPPSHPELLDWMAVDFQESGWDVKRFFRTLMLSATYRQAATTTPEKVAKDPQNRLLSHGARYRMDAEMLRDYALAASGLLVPTIGGPSVKPYQPAGVWESVAMRESNTREYQQDHGENLYRRSMYTFWKRAAPPASMEVLNAPSRETCTVRRERTDTPLQALVTLNDPQFVEAARNLAQTVITGANGDDDRLQLLASRLLARHFKPQELAIVKSSLAGFTSYYASHVEDATKLIAVGESKADKKIAPPVLAAWTALSNELLNLDEVLNKQVVFGIGDGIMDPLQEFTQNITRRHFFAQGSNVLGSAALASMLGTVGTRGAAAVDSPGKPKSLTHHAPKAKHVIYLHMVGGPPQMDTFDPKPTMKEWFDKELPASIRMGQRLTTMTSNQTRFPVAPSVFKFAQYGQNGMWVSEVLPWTAKMVDDLCFVRSMHTEAINHEPAVTMLQTGNQITGRPCLGSWAAYGLGSLNENLPSFVVLYAKATDTMNSQAISARLWSAGYLPGEYAGVPFRSGGDPILFINSPPGMSTEVRRSALDSLQQLNEINYQELGDPETHTRIQQYELAFRMQQSVPGLTDLSDETPATLQLYGDEVTMPGKFANAVLLARRLVERGVRFVQLYINNWDTHNNLPRRLPGNCKDVDQACYGLIQDLKQRGLLDETLVIWGGEFGRTIYSQGNLTKSDYGRDHHPRCFTIWMAGGGTRPGTIYGETDEFSYNITKDPVHVRDFHATVLDLLGFDHERFTYRYQGLDQRLTGVEHARVVKELIL